MAVNLDPKATGLPGTRSASILKSWALSTRLLKEHLRYREEKIPEGIKPLAHCIRLRRGILYRTATELGATKIALGHHRDDILQTLFLNMFYGGKMKGMPPETDER